MARAGRITIDLAAGAAQFTADVDRASAKLNEFGHTGVTNVQAISGGLRVLEGNFGTNIRAAERFLATLPGIGAAFQAAFPVAGAAAVGGIVVELAEKISHVREELEKIKSTPSALQSAFQSLNGSLETSNDELQVSNDKIQNQIAKLQGKPQNNLKQALDDANVSADNLAKTLAGSVAGALKVLQENEIGRGFQNTITAFLANAHDTTQITDQFKQFQIKYNDDLYKATEAVRSATTESGKHAAEAQRDAIAQGELSSQLAIVNARLRENQTLQSLRATNIRYGNLEQLANTTDRSSDIAADQALRSSLQEQLNRIPLAAINLKGVRDLDALKGKTKDTTDYFGNEVAKLRSEIDGLQKEQEAAGKGPGLKALAAGAAQAANEVARLNEELARVKRQPLTADETNTITTNEVAIAQLKTIGQLKNDIAKRDEEVATKQFERQQNITKTIAQINGATAKVGFQTNAVGRGSDAQRDAQIAGIYADARLALGTKSEDGDPGVVQARIAQAMAQFKLQDAQLAQTIIVIESQTSNVGLQIAAFGKGRSAEFAAELAGIRERGNAEGTPSSVINAQIDLATKQNDLKKKQLGIGDSAFDGFKGFFTEFQQNTQSAGNQVKQVLGGAFSGLNTQITDLIIGQKTSFSSFFRGIAADIAQLGLNDLRSSLLKPQTQGGGVGSSLLGSLFSFLPHFAASGDPTGPSLVGENGPELFVPHTAGTIVPNGRFGSGGQTNYYVDARGSDNAAATEIRTRRALREAHQQGATDGARLSRESRRRVPNSKAFAT